MSTLRCRMRLTPLNASIATATNAVKKQRQQSETGPTLTRTNENLYGPRAMKTTRRAINNSQRRQPAEFPRRASFLQNVPLRVGLFTRSSFCWSR